MNKKADLANGNSSNKNKTGSKLNLNRTPLRSKIPQAVSTPPPVTRPASAIPSTRNGRPLANNKASNIAGPKVVNKTSTSANNIAIRQQNHYNSSIQSSRMLSTKTTPTIGQQRIGSNENKSTVASASSSTNLLKSVKPGLAQPTAAIHGSRIPRPSSSSGGQPAKSSPSAATARLGSHASSSSSAMLAAAHRHPSSPSLLLQANNRTTTTTTSGVKSCIPSSHLHKSTSRLHLTHNNKGESSLIRSDLVSAHWKEKNRSKEGKTLFFPISFIAVSRSLHQTNTHNLFRVPVFALCSCVFFFDDCTPQWKLHSLLILLFEYPHYLHPIFLFTCSTVVDCQYRARVITIWLFIHLLTPPSYTNRLDIHSFIRHQKIKRNPWFFSCELFFRVFSLNGHFIILFWFLLCHGRSLLWLFFFSTCLSSFWFRHDSCNLPDDCRST